MIFFFVKSTFKWKTEYEYFTHDERCRLHTFGLYYIRWNPAGLWGSLHPSSLLKRHISLYWHIHSILQNSHPKFRISSDNLWPSAVGHKFGCQLSSDCQRWTTEFCCTLNKEGAVYGHHPHWHHVEISFLWPSAHFLLQQRHESMINFLIQAKKNYI